jgi:hypothetical protein
VAPSTGRIDVQRLEWYDGTFDKGYHGVIDVLEVPGEAFALVSVQHSSQLVLHDLETGAKGSLDLGGRGGNPKLQLREGTTEIWATDYDTVVVIQKEGRRIVRRARLQDARAGAQQFIGDFSFAPDEDS